MTVTAERTDARVPMPADRPRLRLLGGFHIVARETSLDLCDSAQRVIVYLALHRGPQPRAVVAGNLWPEKTDARAGANLRSSLWRLRAPDDVVLVEADGPTLMLARELRVDVDEVQEAGWALLERPSPETAGRLDSEALFADMLPGWYDDWVMIERERLMQLRLHFTEAFVAVLIGAERHAQAVDTAIRLLAIDPLRERSHLALIAAYVAEGNRCNAQRQYDEYADLLERTFRCRPEIPFEAALSWFTRFDHHETLRRPAH